MNEEYLTIVGVLVAGFIGGVSAAIGIALARTLRGGSVAVLSGGLVGLAAAAFRAWIVFVVGFGAPNDLVVVAPVFAVLGASGAVFATSGRSVLLLVLSGVVFGSLGGSSGGYIGTLAGAGGGVVWALFIYGLRPAQPRDARATIPASVPAIIPAALADVGALAISLWMLPVSTEGVDARVPGLDGRTAPAADFRTASPTAGEPIVADGRPSDLPGAWPWFRGPDRDGICHDSVPLAREWPDSGPEVLWTVELGPGHAGSAVWRGRVFVLDYDVDAMADTMRCLSLDDGKEIWRNSYPVEVAESHGRSRTVPAVVDGCVLSLGPRCHAACWDAQTGECRWLLDLVAEYQVKLPPSVMEWHNGQCPLVDDGRVILAPAGEAFMIAVDYRSGKVVWESPEIPSWQMTHSSIAPMDFAGRRMYVYCGSRGVAGVSAEDGSLLWKTTDWVGKMATSPTPVPLGDGRIFLCAGYNAGSLMLRLEESEGRLSASTLFRLRPKQFESEQHTPILYEGHLYGLRTKPGGKQLACLDLDGNELWNSGTDKFWRGPYLIADGLIFVLDEEGLLTFAEATPDAYKPLGSFQVFDDGREAWGPMALAGGRLLLRDLTRMSCLDVSQK